ncbi:MAG: amidohydrolase [Nitrososphaerota archaeon]|jgi:amidohydrolase|nr:amidohydrolase [Nitrososphaerota archaeon]
MSSQLAAAEVSDYVVSLRRHFHRHPELGFNEFETANKIESELRSLGLVPSRVTQTAIVADIKGSEPGRTVAVRADMDGLPIVEENHFDYVSENKGVMHACGHDGHISMLLGLARLLVKDRTRFKGTVRLLFQPAEERPPGGAIEMIKAGVLKDVDFVIGQHTDSTIPTGKVEVWYGPSMANADMFKITIHGKGGHGSEPHDTIDAIVLASQFVVNLQSVISRRKNPVVPAVISVGTFNAGYRDNVIAPRAELTGTVRTLSDDMKALLKDEIEKVAKGVCLPVGASYDFYWEDGYPVLENDPGVAKVFDDVASELLGKENVLHPPPRMGGEDFSYFTKERRGAYFFLGVRNESKGIASPHHSPTFNLDEDALKYGVEILYRSTLRLLDKGA